MKKTVFLFILLFFSATNVDATVAQESFDFIDYQIRLTYLSHEESGRGYTIDKIGDNSFSVEAVYKDQKIYITNVKEINGNHVFYGYTHNYNGDTYYDPFLLILDKEGNEEFLLMEDFGELEELRDVVMIDNVYMVRIEVSDTDERDDFYVIGNIIRSYDSTFQELKTIEIDNEIKRTATTNQLYLYDFDYVDDFDGALTSDLNFIFDDYVDIEQNDIFTDTHTILFLNEALLNDQVVKNGVTIDYPGNYEFVYNDYTYEFTVDATVSGVQDEEIYRSAVYPVIEKGKVYLNNDLFVSGTEIIDPGNYTLSVIGLNNYQKDIHFTIDSNVTGVLNDQTYENDIQIEFDGEGYLNNTYIESPYTVSDNGDYLLKITGEGNYLETYYFSVEKPNEKMGIVEIIQKYDIVVLGVVVIAGGIILKKK